MGFSTARASWQSAAKEYYIHTSNKTHRRDLLDRTEQMASEQEGESSGLDRGGGLL